MSETWTICGGKNIDTPDGRMRRASHIKPPLPDGAEIQVVPRSTLDEALEALERIAAWPCDNNDTGDEAECPELLADPGAALAAPCPSCEARSTRDRIRSSLSDD